MRIAITGEKGFLGIHLTQYFRNILKYEVIELGRNYQDQLASVKELDWLIHGACIHRHPNPETLLALNRKLTDDTLHCLTQNNIKCNIALLSSFHEDLDTPYGQSKREAKSALRQHCTSINKQFISFKLPNIFGKYAVPNKTSFVATFCYNLHNELAIDFNQNIVKLVSVDDVIPIIAGFKESEIPYSEISVEEVYRHLKHFHEINANHKFPKLNSKFELDLYQTYLSYFNYKL
jgi:UDP-2-acetamido-2,6-beta-L-arabino-hexul-4-ose reductase